MISIKMWTVKMTTSDTWFISVGAAGKGLTDSRCFLGQFFLHGRPSRPPTYLVATPGIWCCERPGSSADSDRQGLCVLSVWKRQMGPGICFQLLSLRRHRLAHGDVTDTASSRRDKKPQKTNVESDWEISLSTHWADTVLLLQVIIQSVGFLWQNGVVNWSMLFRKSFDFKGIVQHLGDEFVHILNDSYMYTKYESSQKIVSLACWLLLFKPS